MERIKVGLVGYGVSGRVFHGPLIKSAEGMDLTHVVSSQSTKVLDDFPNAKVIASFDELLKTDVDLVVITTPNTLHYSQCEKALSANKNVIIEKPFVPTSEEGVKIINLAQEKNLMLTVFQSRRWDGDFLTVKQLVEQKKLGDLVFFESHFDRFRPVVNSERWREKEVPGSGILYDLGSHLIDQALILFGKPTSVFADISSLRENAQVDDYFHLIFYYEKMRIVLHCATVVKDVGPRFTLHGTQGSFIKFGLDPQEDELRAGKIPAREENWGVDKEKLFGTLTLPDDEKIKIPTENGNYPEFYNGVYRSLTQKSDPPVLPKSALQNIELLEACIRSAHLGQLLTMS